MAVGLDTKNIPPDMLFIGDNLIILYTKVNFKDSFPKGHCFNIVVGKSSFSVGKIRFFSAQ